MLFNLIIRLLLNGLAVFISAYILEGVRVSTFTVAVIAAVILGVVNTFIKPILILFTLPVTIMTLGLFTLVINAALVLLVSYLVKGFEVDSFVWALLFSLVLWLVNSFLHTFAG